MSVNSCRLCLNNSEVLTDIFDNSCEENEFQFKIHKLFKFWINPSDALKSICAVCTGRIGDFYTFSELVKQTQIKLIEDNFLEEGCYRKALTKDVKTKHKINHTKKNKKNKVKEKLEDGNGYDILQMVKDEKVFSEETEMPEILLGDDYKAEINDESYPIEKTEDIDEFNSAQASPHYNENDPDSDDNLLAYKNVQLNNVQSNVKHKKVKRLREKHIYDVNEPPSFPVELLKDGKMLMKGPPLDALINKFYNLQCTSCPNLLKFERISKLMKHFESVHKIRGYVTCHCNTLLYNHRSVYLHMAKHLQPSAFECPICKKAVTRPHTLKLHMQTHLPEEEKIHKCDECDQCFSYIGSLINHKESHHVPLEERKLYSCHVCGKEYTIKTSLINHMRSHRANTKLLCSECGKTLQSKSDMKNHMLIHHDKTGQNNVQCKHCGFICKNLYYLKAHEKRHTGVKFTCDKCPYTTHRKQQLKQHVRVKHTDEKPFTCAICGKCFRLRSVLNHHMAQHTGEAKYSCSFCSRTFISSGNCYSHRKRMHAEEYKREMSRKLNERFKVIEANPSTEEEGTENIHQLAREYLNKVSKNSVSKAPS